MVVPRADALIVTSDETCQLRKQYRETFGESFPPFNMVEFRDEGELIAGEVYREEIRRCIETNTPYVIKRPGLW